MERTPREHKNRTFYVPESGGSRSEPDKNKLDKNSQEEKMDTKEAVHRGDGGRFSKRGAKKGAKIPKAGGLRTSQKTVTDNKRKTPPENEIRSEADASAEDESEESEEAIGESEEAVENEEEDVPIQ